MCETRVYSCYVYSIFNKEDYLVARTPWWAEKHWSTTKLLSWCQPLDIPVSVTSGEDNLTEKNLGHFCGSNKKTNVNTWKSACWFLPVAASHSSEALGCFWVEFFFLPVTYDIENLSGNTNWAWVKWNCFLYLSYFFHDPENVFAVDMCKTELFWFSLKSYFL